MSAGALAAGRPEYKQGEILIKFRDGVSSAARSGVVRAHNAAGIKALGVQGLFKVNLPATQSVEAAVAQYASDPNVELAQPNYIYRINATPNDFYYASSLWGLSNTGQAIVSPGVGGQDSPSGTNNPGTVGKDISAELAWDIITDCSSVVVAVIDTGVNYNHGDLAANMWNDGLGNAGYDYVDNDNDPMDTNGHGTHVAGTIGAVGNNATGTTGVCWQATIMAIRVLDTLGSGTTADIVSGLNYAVTNGAKVVNMSLGGGSYDAAFNTAITNAKSSGVLLVVAAGNSALNVDVPANATYPCNYEQDNIVCVAALDQDYDLATFSNYGWTHVDIGAPGVNIVSAWPGANATITDPLTAGWSGAGWGYTTLTVGGTPYAFIVNPPAYDRSAATYSNSIDDRFYKSFNLAGVSAADLNFYTIIDTEPVNDLFKVAYDSTGADPFVAGTQLLSTSGSTSGVVAAAQYDISACNTATCAVGFNLVTNATTTTFGVGVMLFSINTLTLDTVSYNVISGTSMATPHVAGVAAMLFAQNPNYTYSDVASALYNGGETAASLNLKTTTGKSLNALGALTYIAAPTNVRATVVESQ